MMKEDMYTPGHTQNATDFMARRSLESHGRFFTPYLRGGDHVLDCGCGPGTITLDIASVVAPGLVTGIDMAESQIQRAQRTAADRGLKNVKFQTASCYALPFEECAFDGLFCHALMEHLSKPRIALREFFRVLKPGGYAGICSPDWDGLLLAPSSQPVTEAAAAYAEMQRSNGGDLRIGHKLGGYMAAAGFTDIQMTARYECYPSLAFIGEYLALQLEHTDHIKEAETFREWSASKGGLFAQAWVSVVGRRALS